MPPPPETFVHDPRWMMLQHKASEIRALHATEFFRKHGIEPIVIKGFAAGRLYPPGKFRVSVDTDIAVSREDHELAKRLVVSQDASGMAIDLHKELRHLDSMPWDRLFHDSTLIPAGDGDVRVLREEDHLRVLCVHWLTDGGANRERLWDIYFGIENRGPAFDWGRFLDQVGPKRRRWLVCSVGAASRYLGLDLRGTPIEGDAQDLPQWFVKTIEDEWASPVGLQPLEGSLGSWKDLKDQVKRRLNPNLISATVQMNGDFDARTRVFYQIGNAFSRILPTYRRISPMLRRR